ncbi:MULTISPECIES: hypothetical protein [Mycobacteriaceae]|jgi:hypothetical protein|uniref:Uncharacterized protein n=4 Tax=Mycobacteriaceae TaxID=1762 RepID=A0A1Y0C617_9MYCO|nr:MULTISPECIES: hypothetical protein [Mycobacteriaceae]ART70660.1 hypothetical protein BTO20_20840 [Mycobacterium dioxanotrophicus]MBP2451781.1 hypothetical protein [Mycolicibacterium lutetiense]OHT88323.1 hypothetical protein BKG61_27670 [Mycobacterium syngnathidarum]OLT97688.1 hypothetical protein BKG60_04780 [Mycobacterium syngnathidarum]UBV13075.1 hypothetical protein H8Z57_19615 [Mycolicibacterium fortuitum]
MAGFDAWIDTFVEEKGVDLEHRFDVDGPQWGWNSIPLSVVIDTAKNTSPAEQEQIKKQLVEIDFKNGDAMHFFEFLAQQLAR